MLYKNLKAFINIIFAIAILKALVISFFTFYFFLIFI